MGKKRGIRETDEKRAGSGILAKKGQECGIRTPPSRPSWMIGSSDIFMQQMITPSCFRDIGSLDFEITLVKRNKVHAFTSATIFIGTPSLRMTGMRTLKFLFEK